MRLLRCLIMILATLAMTVHVASAAAVHAPQAAPSISHEKHDHHAHDHHLHGAGVAVAAKPCPPAHHHADHGCCDTPCGGSCCFAPMTTSGAFEPAFRVAAPLRPAPDRLPSGTFHGLPDRPPISA